MVEKSKFERFRSVSRKFQIKRKLVKISVFQFELVRKFRPFSGRSIKEAGTALARWVDEVVTVKK